MDAHHKKISVIIPGYNAGTTIVAAIESVLSQDWPNVECIVVDDGSTDDSAERVAPYLDRIRYVHKHNGGFASARNLGMQQASGDFIAWLDADDIFEPDKLRRQMAAFDACPELGLVCSDFSLFDHGGTIWESAARRYYSIFECVRGYDQLYTQRVELDSGDVLWSGQVFSALLDGNFIHPPTVLFRREVFEQAGPQCEPLVNATDYEYFCRIAQHWPVGFIEAPLLRYRVSPQQSSSPANYARNARYNQMALRHLLGNYPLTDQQRSCLTRRLGDLQMAQARHLADADKLEAMRIFIQAQRGRIPTLKSLWVLAKILTPACMIRWRRRNLVQQQRPGF